MSDLGTSGAFAGDVLLIAGSDFGDLGSEQRQGIADLHLPIVMAIDDSVAADVIDAADAMVFDDDDAATIAFVVAGASAADAQPQVREFSDVTSRTITALSAEAGRIATALARLAAEQADNSALVAKVDAVLVRRLIRLRRDRDRFFPAEVFADPAWDMLLDLIAARMEGRSVPVSSLCIAAAVPTTTALRWVRSLSEAGLFQRNVDPVDARRSYVTLSTIAADAMLAWLRLFSSQFAMR